MFVKKKLVDFATLRKSLRPNCYLVATAEHCPHAKADMPSPVLAHPPSVVLQAWERVVARQPRTRRVDEDASANRVAHVQHSRLMRFRDSITAQFLAEGDGSQTLVLVYSASTVGYSDLGVNKSRVLSWLAQLNEELAVV